jgi:hypothetical protein
MKASFEIKEREELRFEFDYKIPSCCIKANYSEDFQQNGCF